MAATEALPNYDQSQPATKDPTESKIESKEEEAAAAANARKSSRDRQMSRQQSAPNVKTRVSLSKEKKSKNKSKNKNNSNNNTNNNNNSNSNDSSAPNESTKLANNNTSMNSVDSVSNSQTANSSSGEEMDLSDAKHTQLLRTKSLPPLRYEDPCREFDNFAGDWVDSKGQPVIISAWGVIRYPNNPKLRFEAIHMGPNHLSVTFDRDPKKRKFVGKLNHDCDVLIWSNDTRWTKKGSKHTPQSLNDANANGNNNGSNNDGTNNGGNSNSNSDGSDNENGAITQVQRQGSCIVM